LSTRFDHKNEAKFFSEQDKIRKVIAEAFKTWKNKSLLSFEEVAGETDILLTFEDDSHPEQDKFLLSSSVMAHSFYPGQGIGGDVHYSKSVNWDFDVLSGEKPREGEVSFFAVTLHSIGHSLGLAHSSDENSVMFPFMKESSSKISQDDINGINHLYGVPKATNSILENEIDFDP
jgi:predicted Zn-dependent protease